MKTLSRYFLEGLLFLVPVAVTVYVFYVVFAKIDGLLNFPFPGAGVLATIALVTLIGFLASNFLTRGILGLFDGLLVRVPIVRLLYSTVKDLVSAFVSDRKTFDRPVLVSVSADDSVKVAGFMTRDCFEEWGCADYVAVYLPQSYNIAGNVVVVRRDRVTPITAESSDIMTFIVSGGVTGKGRARR